MLMSEAQEIGYDRKYAPHQFSADYGAVGDDELNAYINEIGLGMARVSHRPQMPYNFRALNAVIANAYTFPGGSVGVARGLLIAMESEAELAGVLGHEIGHVCSRHAAQQMTKGILAQVAVIGVTLYVEQEKEKYMDLAYMLGSMASGALLAHYSRDDEREADSLGMSYMVKAGHNPNGMTELMAALMEMKESEPSSVEMLFATHPLTRERWRRAQGHCKVYYAEEMSRKMQRERFMDHTVCMRAIAPAIHAFERGQRLMMEQKFSAAEEQFRQGLKLAQDDYAGLMLASKCMIAMERIAEAEHFAKLAQASLPGEPQATQILGMVAMGRGQYDKALSMFNAYDQKLPGNAETQFLTGRCYERMGQRNEAKVAYRRYLLMSPSGINAKHAQSQLAAWSTP
jgi:predicted Zn-dependent protease